MKEMKVITLPNFLAQNFEVLRLVRNSNAKSKNTVRHLSDVLKTIFGRESFQEGVS